MNFNFCVYGKTPKEVAKKIAEIATRGPKKKKATSASQQTFGDFAKYYFEKFRQRKVGKKTYQGDLNRLKLHVLPFIGKKVLKRITPSDCQDIIDRLTEMEKFKSANEVFSLMNVVFKGAIAHNIITKNPNAIVYKENYESEHRLYDLRTTFYSKCKECGVEESAYKEFMGHSLGALGNAYTSLSDEYLIEQAKKLDY